MIKRRAVVLAGGKGTRLKPYTIVLPKPLMPIGDYPVLEVIVRQLKQYHFTHITMAVNHHAEIIKAFFAFMFVKYDTVSLREILRVVI